MCNFEFRLIISYVLRDVFTITCTIPFNPEYIEIEILIVLEIEFIIDI